jgi:hypothetical protein
MSLRRSFAALVVALLGLPVCSLLAYGQTQPPPAAPGQATTVRVMPSDPGDGDDAATEMAKKVENPVSDLYLFPFQNNLNFNYGPRNGTQDLLNFQPVIPIHINSNWNVITRTVLPMIWQPSLQPMHTVPFGTGPTTFSAFLTPAKPINGWLFGAGPAIQIPTITDKTLGSNVWGAGPTAVVAYMKGPWVVGALTNNVWSLGGTSGLAGTRYNTFLLQPILNYNFSHGWFVGSVPLITANWLASGKNVWTVPVGAGGGRLIFIGGKLPINMSLSAFYDPIRPQQSATWQIRMQITVVL